MVQLSIGRISPSRASFPVDPIRLPVRGLTSHGSFVCRGDSSIIICHGEGVAGMLCSSDVGLCWVVLVCVFVLWCGAIVIMLLCLMAHPWFSFLIIRFVKERTDQKIVEYQVRRKEQIVDPGG